MTLSPERRRRDQDTALRIVAADVGDDPLFCKYCRLADPRLKDLASTTSVELQEKLLIANCSTQDEVRYRLTEPGWVAGLRLNGTLDDPAFRERCINLVKWLKQLVDGRHDQTAAMAHHQNWPPEFPFGWMLNILNSALLQQMFTRQAHERLLAEEHIERPRAGHVRHAGRLTLWEHDVERRLGVIVRREQPEQFSVSK